MSDDLPMRLKEIRMYLDVSGAAMAKKVGLKTSNSWMGYERGNNTPKADALMALVDLGFNANWLLTGEGAFRLEREEASYRADGTFNEEVFISVYQQMEADIAGGANIPAGSRGQFLLAAYRAVMRDRENRG